MTKEAFDQQIISLRSMLYYVSYGLLGSSADQDDAVQETLRKAIEKRGMLRDGARLKSWVTRILVNECYNILRRRAREIPSEDFVPETPPDADSGLFEALMALEIPLRLPLILHYYEGYATREIAAILRVPEGTIKGRLVRARKRLEELLTDKEALA